MFEATPPLDIRDNLDKRLAFLGLLSALALLSSRRCSIAVGLTLIKEKDNAESSVSHSRVDIRTSDLQTCLHPPRLNCFDLDTCYASPIKVCFQPVRIQIHHVLAATPPHIFIMSLQILKRETRSKSKSESEMPRGVTAPPKIQGPTVDHQHLKRPR